MLMLPPFRSGIGRGYSTPAGGCDTHVRTERRAMQLTDDTAAKAGHIWNDQALLPKPVPVTEIQRMFDAINAKAD
jgi:hypothetical protein